MFLKHGPKKLGTQPLANTVMSSVVLVVHVYSESLRDWGFMITEVAGVGLDSKVYCFDMPIQISCQECFVVTEFTSEAGLDLQMYHFTMSFQIT